MFGIAVQAPALKEKAPIDITASNAFGILPHVSYSLHE